MITVKEGTKAGVQDTEAAAVLVNTHSFQWGTLKGYTPKTGELETDHPPRLKLSFPGAPSLTGLRPSSATIPVLPVEATVNPLGGR